MINSPTNHFQQQNSSNFLQQLLRVSPFAILWGGVWLLVVAIAGVGLVGLFSPGVETGEFQQLPSTTTTSTATTDSTATKQTDKPIETESQASLPLWVFAAVIFGCGVSSLIITYVLKYSNTTSPRVRRSSKSTRFSKSSKRIRRPKSSQPNLTSSRPTQQKTVKRAIAKSYKISRQPETSQPVTVPRQQIQQQPVVTVVSPHELTPVDNRELTLAESMDLRNHHSLSSLIREL